jgi:hypothetical protein
MTIVAVQERKAVGGVGDWDLGMGRGQTPIRPGTARTYFRAARKECCSNLSYLSVYWLVDSTHDTNPCLRFGSELVPGQNVATPEGENPS